LTERPRSSRHENQRKADKVQFIAALGWGILARKLIGQQRPAPSPGPMVLGRGLEGDAQAALQAHRAALPVKNNVVALRK